MPRREVNRAVNFIIEEESWSVVEYDHTSVPGILYLSLTENKINNIYDDVENRIADIDTRANYSLIIPPTTQHFAVGDVITPAYSIMKNGVPYTPEKVSYTSNNTKVVKIINEQITAVGQGEATLYITIDENIDIEAEPLSLDIVIDENATEISYYIDGPDQIRLDRVGVYKVYSQSGELTSISNVTIDSNLATVIYDSEKIECRVRANNKNLLGTCILTVQCANGQTVSKTISIIPLW